MRLRTLFGLLIALAVLFAPSAVAAEHMAAEPAHQMQMMQMGHCDAAPAKGDHDKAPGKSCCLSMCMAVAVSPGATLIGIRTRHAPAYFLIGAAWRGVVGEIATPPPRHA